jgi:hypothetical protein
MRDPYLVALVRAVEAGEPCPRIWITLTSGDLLSGIPCPARQFVEGSFESVTRRNMIGAQRIPIRNQDERRVAAEARANEEIKPFNVEIDVTDGRALTLRDVTIRWGGSKDGANIHAVRVNLDAIALWWIAGGEEVKGRGGGFFLGAAIPVDVGGN